MRRALLALASASLILSLPAAAMVGGAGKPPRAIANAVVVVVGSRGKFCSGAVPANRDLVLTAAHCVLPGSEYKIVEYGAGQPELRDVAQVRAHPGFNLQTLLAHRATADVALIKLAAPLRNAVRVVLATGDLAVAVGDSFTVAGAGVSVRGDGKSGGTVRAASLVATGQPGTLQIRLYDAATRGEKDGSLALARVIQARRFFVSMRNRHRSLAIVSWSTGPGNLTSLLGGLRRPHRCYSDFALSRLGSQTPQKYSGTNFDLAFAKMNDEAASPGITANANHRIVWGTRGPSMRHGRTFAAATQGRRQVSALAFILAASAAPLF